MPAPDPLELFSAPTRAWFATTFAAPTAAQDQGWPAIASGDNALILAPTGSGKTLAAFLYGLDRLMASTDPNTAAGAGPRLLYVSPLRALAFDVERNLRAPLAGIQLAAERLGQPVRAPVVAMRTGDTPARVPTPSWTPWGRCRARRSPPPSSRPVCCRPGWRGTDPRISTCCVPPARSCGGGRAVSAPPTGG